MKNVEDLYDNPFARDDEEEYEETDEIPTMTVKEVKKIVRESIEIFGRLYLRPEEDAEDEGTIFRLSKMEALHVLQTQFAHLDSINVEMIGNKLILG